MAFHTDKADAERKPAGEALIESGWLKRTSISRKKFRPFRDLKKLSDRATRFSMDGKLENQRIA